ncbi:hypothetical protein BG97_1707 [Burkholderia pseudomallei 7894]|uniref:hypothetical protein n=1 Tax=Burkholderia pseudomallei TaxID=28450 RepID=UPI0005D779BF|nr:hypothetical protein [Burkholderia pseudomallei]AJX80419.1 hypothetical protein BG97_1707 [Burkholderia pseudomallei 7894]
MPARSFLLEECANVKRVLEETLRFEYGVGGSKDFYEECSTRLAFITSEIEAADEHDLNSLAINHSLLLELSKLISRIERSSLGQYSWPFVDELKEIASAICAEETLNNSDVVPMVHVLSEGGLTAYAINPEQQRPSAGKRRILTIIFPRTLKHAVLLHSILGHEIGHAIWRSSKHQATLNQALLDAFSASAGHFSAPTATVSWLYSNSAPVEVRTRLATLQAQGLAPAQFFQWASWDAWKEEILCDLIGILTFGPSFIAAECHLLYSIDLLGINIGQAHPPVACRVNLFLTAAKILGYCNTVYRNKDVQNAFNSFWGELESYKKADPWFDVFTEAEITTALTEIGRLLNSHPPAAFQMPDLHLFEHLYLQLKQGIPPVGFKLDREKKPTTSTVDFRHILYAGWLAAKSDASISFHEINRLCEHAIMQQAAIKIYKSNHT